VLAIQPCGLYGGQEELGAVGVGASISHGQVSGSGVLQLEVLITELLTIDGFAASAVVVGEVSSLTHEVGDDAVEGGTLVSKALLSGTKSTEVLSGLWDYISTKLHLNPSKRLAIGGHVEVNLWLCHYARFVCKMSEIAREVSMACFQAGD